MNKEDLIDKLIEYFFIEDKSLVELEIPEDLADKRELLDNIITSHDVTSIPDEILNLEDQLLNIELNEKGIVNAYEVDTVNKTLLSDEEIGNILSLWQGDITRLKVDAIVNPANKVLNLTIPSHRCIDRLIHSKAGMRLKKEFQELGKEQVTNELNNPKITNSYNLPCKYIIHITGPYVRGSLTEENKEDLKVCYLKILELAKRRNLKTIAIPCISTGSFHFPKNEAAIIAFNTIKEFILSNPEAFHKIIINVYTNEDYNAYKKLL